MANQLTELATQAGLSLPSLGGVFSLVLGIFLFLFIAIGLALLTWWLMGKIAYNKHIIIFQKVGQIFEPVGRDVAKEFSIGVGGEKVLFLKKCKLWKVAEKQASRNTYWFGVLDDGYWYNITLGDLNLELGEFKVTGINPEMHKLMRYQNAGLRKNLAERHLKKKWYEQPIFGWIGASLFVLMVGILFIMIGKYYFDSLPRTLELLNQVLERIHNLIIMLENTGCK